MFVTVTLRVSIMKLNDHIRVYVKLEHKEMDMYDAINKLNPQEVV
jgi:hypothetical protein